MFLSPEELNLCSIEDLETIINELQKIRAAEDAKYRTAILDATKARDRKVKERPKPTNSFSIPSGTALGAPSFIQTPPK